jgi:NAD(P)-dependent dehydrogenase (short-subunit alcohol dehydrogenase family)
VSPINVLGVLLASREAMKYFGPGGGSVINISSVASMSPTPTTVVYSATKGAVDTITRVLAKELGPKKIRVNAINPGGVETEGVHSMGIIGSEFEKQLVARTPLGRLGQPDDIASVAVFLSSAASGWMTGETQRRHQKVIEEAPDLTTPACLVQSDAEHRSIERERDPSRFGRPTVRRRPSRRAGGRGAG